MVSKVEVQRGVFIGRFEPFHNGHQSVLEQMDEDCDIDEIIIGIGSSQYRNTLNNPFSSRERKIMISRSLKIEKPYRIIDIPDIHNYPLWASYVEKLLPKFKVVYSGNKDVRCLFAEKGYRVKEPKALDQISATAIRRMMIMGANWRPFVSEETYEAMHSFGGVRRLLEIHNRSVRPVVASDMLIVYQGKDSEGLVLEERLYNPFKGFKAIPGGHLEVGFENTKEAAVRETEEEIGLKLDPQKVNLFNVYSDPQRDPRGPYIAVVYWTVVTEGILKAGDDAKKVKVYPFDKIPQIMAFDHKLIIDDFLSKYLTKQ